ncbi:MAG: hypothetical protein SFU91_08495 [Chloroherpetonaceae bacterium]|nr:hypothetical protein [Chloroherpetonaceae bacterium]
MNRKLLIEKLLLLISNLKVFKGVISLTLIGIMGCQGFLEINDTVIFNNDFEFDAQGWRVGYSDYPSNLTLTDSLELYQFRFGYSQLPQEISPPQFGIRVRGINRSDDLFMYLKKQIIGLEPNQSYRITFSIEIASNVPTNAVGAGGAPGESVYLKAGAKEYEPLNFVDENNFYRLNVDKGNQSIVGIDATLLGNIGVSDTTTIYELILRESQTSLICKSNSDGAIWVFVGTDSGYEGLTEIYYNSIRVTATSQRN